MDTPEILLLLLLLLLLPYGRINSRMTSYLKIFVLIDFHFQDAIFPQPRGDAPSRLLDLARPGTMSRVLTAADPRSRPSPALLPCRASESEVSGALRDGAKDLARRNFLSTPFQMLPDQKFREQPGGQI